MVHPTSDRAKSLEAAFLKVFTEDFPAKDESERIENLQSSIRVLAAYILVYNILAETGIGFDQATKVSADPATVKAATSVANLAEDALDAVVATALNGTAGYSQEWFLGILKPATALAYAQAKGLKRIDGQPTGFVDALIEGLVVNLVGCLAGDISPRRADDSLDTSVISEEVKDSIVNDFKDEVEAAIAKTQDKWASYFASVSASKPTRATR